MKMARPSCSCLVALATLGCVIAGTSGCQTAQDQYVATPLDANGKAIAPEAKTPEIIVSGEEWSEMSSPLLGAVEVTFENHSARWAHLRTTSIQFGTEVVDQAVDVPAGEDLLAWQQATLRRIALQGGFRRSAIAATWAAAAGRVISLPSLHALFANEPAGSPGSAMTRALFPPGYLLGEVISVPPGLFAKRWIVFHTPEPRVTGCLRQMQLGYQLDDGQVNYVRLPFRDRQSRSEWQAGVCTDLHGQSWQDIP